MWLGIGCYEYGSETSDSRNGREFNDFMLVFQIGLSCQDLIDAGLQQIPVSLLLNIYVNNRFVWAIN